MNENQLRHSFNIFLFLNKINKNSIYIYNKFYLKR